MATTASAARRGKGGGKGEKARMLLLAFWAFSPGSGLVDCARLSVGSPPIPCLALGVGGGILLFMGNKKTAARGQP